MLLRRPAENESWRLSEGEVLHWTSTASGRDSAMPATHPELETEDWRRLLQRPEHDYVTMWMRGLKKKTIGEARMAFENHGPTSTCFPMMRHVHAQPCQSCSRCAERCNQEPFTAALLSTWTCRSQFDFEEAQLRPPSSFLQRGLTLFVQGEEPQHEGLWNLAVAGRNYSSRFGSTYGCWLNLFLVWPLAAGRERLPAPRVGIFDHLQATRPVKIKRCWESELRSTWLNPRIPHFRQLAVGPSKDMRDKVVAKFNKPRLITLKKTEEDRIRPTLWAPWSTVAKRPTCYIGVRFEWLRIMCFTNTFSLRCWKLMRCCFDMCCSLVMPLKETDRVLRPHWPSYCRFYGLTQYRVWILHIFDLYLCLFLLYNL